MYICNDNNSYDDEILLLYVVWWAKWCWNKSMSWRGPLKLPTIFHFFSSLFLICLPNFEHTGKVKCLHVNAYWSCLQFTQMKRLAQWSKIYFGIKWHGGLSKQCSFKTVFRFITGILHVTTFNWWTFFISHWHIQHDMYTLSMHAAQWMDEEKNKVWLQLKTRCWT